MAFILQEEAAQYHRVQKLCTFADYLCGIEPPMLDFNTSALKYESLIEPPSLSEKTTSAAAAAARSQQAHSHEVIKNSNMKLTKKTCNR